MRLICKTCGNTQRFYQRARVTELQEIDGSGSHLDTLETYDCDVIPDSYECANEDCDDSSSVERID